MRVSLLFFLFAAMLCSVQAVQASPGFTRQTGAACKVCHYTDMRSLNAYGRKFLLNSFQETQKMLEERRKLEEDASQSGGGRDIEARNGHQEDQGGIEAEENMEATESLENGSIEDQGGPE